MRKTFFAFIMVGTLIVLAPKCLQTNWAKGLIEKSIEKQLGGSVKITSLSLSWTGEQKCLGVTWTQPKSKLDVLADSVTIQGTLFDVLRYHDRPLKVLVEGGQMVCQAKMKFLKKKGKGALNLRFSPITGTLENGGITFDKMAIDVKESVRVITWGHIDFAKNRMKVVFGLPPKTLHKFFGIEGLPDNYLLEIPIETKLSAKSLERKLLGFFLTNYAKLTSLQR